MPKAKHYVSNRCDHENRDVRADALHKDLGRHDARFLNCLIDVEKMKCRIGVVRKGTEDIKFRLKDDRANTSVCDEKDYSKRADNRQNFKI